MDWYVIHEEPNGTSGRSNGMTKDDAILFAFEHLRARVRVLRIETVDGVQVISEDEIRLRWATDHPKPAGPATDLLEQMDAMIAGHQVHAVEFLQKLRSSAANDEASIGTIVISAPAGMSLMITRVQRAELRKRGFSDDAIREMSPADAHALLT